MEYRVFHEHFCSAFELLCSTPLKYSMEHFWSTSGVLLDYLDYFWTTFGPPTITHLYQVVPTVTILYQAVLSRYGDY